MRRLLWVPIIALVLVAPIIVHAGSSSGFNGVVDAIESRYHAHATRIPLMAVISLVAHKTTSDGVSGVHVAEFENFSEPVDGDELNAMVEQKLGAGWSRMIRETGKKGKEQTLIFAHPEGNRMGLFVVDLDGNDLDVVQVSVDPDHLNQTIGKYDREDADRRPETNDTN